MTEVAQNVKWIGENWKKEEVLHGKVFTFSDRPQARYAWDTGEAIGRYLAGFKQGKILGVRCRGCQRVMVPPRIFCELCFRDISEWVTLKETGRIRTFSVCYVTWDMKRIRKPQIPAVIEIDGASEGMGILHLVEAPRGDKPWERLRAGTRVQAVWKPKGLRRGAVTDIRFWRVLTGNANAGH